MRLLAALLLALATLVPACAQTGPTADLVTLRSQALGEDRAINIYVPPGYAEWKGRYPVLYMLDGGVREGFASMTMLVDQGIAKGEVQGLILVGIAQRDRNSELVPSSRSAAFRRFIADEVKPWVEKNYRTNGHDTISGGSYGGLFVVDTLLHEPDLFDDYVAVSPSLWWGGGRLVDQGPGLLAKAPPAPRRLWLAIGNEGPTMRVDAFVAMLRKQAPAWLSWSFTPFPRETHMSVYHPAAERWVPAFFPARPETRT
ncbi:MAG: alpha/beta hydrolase [Sphingomonas sp.]